MQPLSELFRDFLTDPDLPDQLDEGTYSRYFGYLENLVGLYSELIERPVGLHGLGDISRTDYGYLENLVSEEEWRVWRYFYKWLWDKNRIMVLPFPTILDNKKAVLNFNQHFQASIYSIDRDPPVDDCEVDLGDMNPGTKWDPLYKTPWSDIDYAGGSDYSGNAISLSNYRLMEDQFVVPECNLEHPLRRYRELLSTHGGYGSYGIIVRATYDNPDFLETMDSLGNYPVMDESDLSELESEREIEAWEHWAQREANAHAEELVQEILEDYLESDPEILDIIDPHRGVEEIPDVDIAIDFGSFERLRDAANEYWVDESSGAYIDVSRVFQSLDDLPSTAILEMFIPEYKQAVLRRELDRLGLLPWQIEELPQEPFLEAVRQLPQNKPVLELTIEELMPVLRLIPNPDLNPLQIEPDYLTLRNAIEQMNTLDFEYDPQRRRQWERVSYEQEFEGIPRSILRRRPIHQLEKTGEGPWSYARKILNAELRDFELPPPYHPQRTIPGFD